MVIQRRFKRLILMKHNFQCYWSNSTKQTWCFYFSQWESKSVKESRDLYILHIFFVLAYRWHLSTFAQKAAIRTADWTFSDCDPTQILYRAGDGAGRIQHHGGPLFVGRHQTVSIVLRKQYKQVKDVENTIRQTMKHL